MADLGGKVAIVTGASRGTGAIIAERLAADGFAVVVNYLANADAADATVRRIEETGGFACAVQADVSDPEAVRGMFDAAEAAYGGIDVLVNNAGIVSLAPFAEMDDAQFDRLIAVNFKGTFNTLREAAERLRTGGRIVNFSSSLAALERPTYGPYAATKAAVETMTRIMSKELAGRGITVNAVKLPSKAVGMCAASAPPENQDERPLAAAPTERPSRPEDIARLVAFLAGPDAGWISGRNLRADGNAGVERLVTPPSPPAWHRAVR